MTYDQWKATKPAVNGPVPASRTISEFIDMPGTWRKLDAAGVSATEARKLLMVQLREYGIPSGSFRKMSAGDQQSVLDGALARVISNGTRGRAGAATEALQRSLSRGEAMSARAVRAVVGRVVPLGPAEGMSAADYIDLSGMARRHARKFEEAVRYVPTSTLETVKRGKVKAVCVPGPIRPEFDPETSAIRFGWDADELELVHELMHAFEEHDPAFLEAEREYFEKRTRGKRPVPLRKLTGNASYNPKETVYDMRGNCIDSYAFKDYGGDAYELMSLGV